jgi:hypothetical protein
VLPDRLYTRCNSNANELVGDFLKVLIKQVEISLFSNPFNPTIIAATATMDDDQSNSSADPGKYQTEQPASIEVDAPSVPAAARSTRRRRKK